MLSRGLSLLPTERHTIGEFAKLAGVSAKALRFYDQLQLLRPAFVDPRTRYRYYLAQQMRDLADILALRELGIRLEQIRGLRQTGAIGPKRELLEQRRKEVLKAMASAKSSLRSIDSTLVELQNATPPVSVVLKQRPAARIASVRAKVRSYEDILEIERELLGQLPRQARGDLRGVLWHRCADSGSLEGEPFVEVKGPLARGSFYELKELPAATVASAYSTTDDRDAEHASKAVRKWIALRGLRLAGPKREIYLNEFLEIQFPVRAA